MKLAATKFVCALSLVWTAWCFSEQQAVLGSDWATRRTSQDAYLGSENCTASRMTRYTQVRRGKPIFFSTNPLDDFEAPAVEPVNSTAGEQWEFDGVSHDGTQSFIFGFSRDPNWAFSGTGNLRVYAEFALANRTRYAIVDYAEESVVESCPGEGTRGTWKGKDFQYSFLVSSDYSQVTISFKNPEADATIIMTSAAPPRYPDNQLWPSQHATKEAVRHFYWVEPVPVADVVVSATINGTVVDWNGMGGHERLWHAFNWPTCIAGMLVTRLHVGPYALSLVEFGSKSMGELSQPSVMLVKGGEKIFASQLGQSHERDDHVRVRKLYGGEGVATEKLADKITGVELILDSPSKKKTWKFIVTHRNIGFEYGFSDGSGGTGYSGIARGGETGSKELTGPAFTELLRFPKKSWLITNNYVS